MSRRSLFRSSELRGLRWQVCVLVVGLIFAHAVPSAAQAKKPLKEVDVDLRAGIVNDVLPFDEKFIVTATIDDTVNDVRAWIAPITKRSSLSVQGDVVCPNPEDAGWAATTEWNGNLPAGVPAPQAGTPRKFRLLFPPLDANGFYCVRFELGPDQTPPPETIRTFITQVEQLVDRLLRRYANAPTVPSAETIKLRRDMLAALRTLSGGLTPRGRPGSIFDTTLKDEAVHRQMLDLLQPIVNAQAARRSAINNLATAETALGTNAADVDRRSRDLATLPDQRKTDLVQLSGQATLSSDLSLLESWRSNHQQQVSAAAIALANVHEAWGTAPVDTAIAAVSSALTTVNAGLAIITRIRAALFQANEKAKSDAAVARTAAVNANGARATADQIARQRRGQSDAALTAQAAVAAADAAAAANADASLKDVEVARTAAELDNAEKLLAARNGEVPALERAAFGLGEVRQQLVTRAARVQQVTADIEARALREVTLLVTSQGNFETRHGWYVSMDAGLAYGWDINEAFGYLGTNIYFRPVNKDAPLQNFGNFRQSFTRRVSALIGLTVTGQVEEAGRREALLGGRILVLGGGVRMTDSIRLNGGALVFKAIDPNPLVTERRVELSPFISMSYDIDVIGTLGDLGKVFGVTNPPAAKASRTIGVPK